MSKYKVTTCIKEGGAFQEQANLLIMYVFRIVQHQQT